MVLLVSWLQPTGNFSNFIEVESLQTTTVLELSSKCSFSRYGVPDTLITDADNGPQFTCEEFTAFSKDRGFEHITSSLQYPQLNGKALKRIFNKCWESGKSEFRVLLDWCNTPMKDLVLAQHSDS